MQQQRRNLPIGKDLYARKKVIHSVDKSGSNIANERHVMETRENCSAKFQVKKKEGEIQLFGL